jgi:SAM-dependent methyltransferase
LYHSPLQTFQPRRTYDVITCFDVLEHVHDLDRALEHLGGLLAPGGILALAVPVYDTLPGRLFGIIDRDPTHIHRHGRRFWLERVREAGLEPITCKGILRAPLPGYFVHAISRLFWWSSSAVFVVCTRRERAAGMETV